MRVSLKVALFVIIEYMYKLRIYLIEKIKGGI